MNYPSAQQKKGIPLQESTELPISQQTIIAGNSSLYDKNKYQFGQAQSNPTFNVQKIEEEKIQSQPKLTKPLNERMSLQQQNQKQIPQQTKEKKMKPRDDGFCGCLFSSKKK